MGCRISRNPARSTGGKVDLHSARSEDSLQVDPIARGFDVVVYGHSHVPKIDATDGVLYLNPGSAGRRRFRLPVTLATIDVLPNGLRPLLHDLGV